MGSIRIFSDVSNIPTRALEGRRVTRASRKVLGEISGANIPRATVGGKRKSNVVGNLRLGQKKASSQTKTKVGVKRTVNVVTKNVEEKLEERGAVRSDFLSGCPITEKMRAVLIDWLVEVQMQFKLLQETLFLTVNTIDRFLAVEGKNVYKSRLQLVGVAAMFLVSKIEEVY